MKTVFSAKAPAKLIISGEHAVAYGAPAIAMAINQYVVTTVSLAQQKTINPVINFNLLSLKYAKSHPIKTLFLFANRLQDNYNAFLNGKCSIREVIKKPFELLQYSVTNLLEKLQFQLSRNLDIQVDSSIPIGSGLGSSAAVIISCLRSLVHLFKLKWDPSKFLKIGTDIENLQHGKSSGIDLYTSTFGGVFYFNNNYQNLAEKIVLPNFDLKIINTGTPAATTGECVATVKDCFLKNDLELISKFSKITEIIKQALITNNRTQLLAAIRENHALLCAIKVVPQKVQAFIEEVEFLGGAAKICGAGSVYGDNAGVLLLLGEQSKIAKIAANYNYQLQDVSVDFSGVTIV